MEGEEPHGQEALRLWRHQLAFTTGFAREALSVHYHAADWEGGGNGAGTPRGPLADAHTATRGATEEDVDALFGALLKWLLSGTDELADGALLALSHAHASTATLSVRPSRLSHGSRGLPGVPALPPLRPVPPPAHPRRSLPRR